MKQDANGRWVRAEPSALGPDRSFGGYYRSADRVVDGKVLRGAPLKTTEDAVVAAVQMGYRVVDEQIERGMRVAQKLRGGAAQRSGDSEPGQAFDAGERMASNAMMSGLQWLETLSSEPGSAFKRLVSTEYRMLADMLGLLRDAGRREAGRDGQDEGRSEGHESDAHGAASPHASRVRILHDADSARRAVTMRTWAVAPAVLAQETAVVFYLLGAAAPRKLASAHVSHDGTVPVLRLATREDDPGGRWRAAVCSPQGEQLGVIEIEL